MILHQLARSIHEIDEAHWDAVAGCEITMTHRWQRVVQASWRHYEPYYLLLRDNQGPLAAVVVNTAMSFGHTGWRDRLLQRLTMMVVAPFSALNCGMMVRPNVTLAAVLPEIDHLLRQLVWREKRLLLGISNVAQADLPTWRAHNFLAFAKPAASILDLPSDYDQYLQLLPSKERSEFRRMRRRAQALDVRFEHGPIAGEGEQFYPLLCEVFARYGTSSDEMPFTAQFFNVLEREMTGQVIVFKGYVRDKLAGVSLCLTEGRTLWCPIMGLRYQLAHPAYLYFLLPDEMVRWSIAQGVRQIHGGLSNEREKQKHGFRPQERWFCCRFSPPLLHRAVTLMLPLFQSLRGRSSHKV